MATEKRLIDAIALIGKARRMETTDNNGIHVDTFAVPVMAIEDAPTVDAVEVVRCKDCKISFYNPFFSDDGKQLICRKWANNHIVNEDDFCSYGERKDNG